MSSSKLKIQNSGFSDRTISVGLLIGRINYRLAIVNTYSAPDTTWILQGHALDVAGMWISDIKMKYWILYDVLPVLMYLGVIVQHLFREE